MSTEDQNRRPSLEELENILSGEDERPVETLPSGEIVGSAKAAGPEIVLPFVSSSEVIDKIQHAQELIEIVQGQIQDEALDGAIKTLDEAIEMLPGWLFVSPEK